MTYMLGANLKAYLGHVVLAALHGQLSDCLCFHTSSRRCQTLQNAKQHAQSHNQHAQHYCEVLVVAQPSELQLLGHHGIAFVGNVERTIRSPLPWNHMMIFGKSYDK
jgi:hypothetical protein